MSTAIPSEDYDTERDFILTIKQAITGGYTRSIRGNCTTHADQLPPGPSLLSSRQCIITVSHSFLDVALDGADVWLSDLYIRLEGTQDSHDTVIRAARGNLWMTKVSLIGKGYRSRGIEVGQERRLYARESIVTGFTYAHSAAVHLAPGATATFVETKFSNNTASRSDAFPSGPAVGPDVGLQAPPPLPPGRRRLRGASGVPGASARFHSCRFEGSTAQPAHSVAIDTAACLVYSDSSAAPLMYDQQLQKLTAPWVLVDNPAANQYMQADSPEAVFRLRGFPTEADPSFRQLVDEEKSSTGLFNEDTVPLPPAADYTVSAPGATPQLVELAEVGADTSSSEWSPVKLALVFSVAGAILAFLLVIVGVLMRALLLQKRKQANLRSGQKWPEEASQDMPRFVPPEPPRSSLPADDSLVAMSLGTGTTGAKSAFSLSGRHHVPPPPMSGGSEELLAGNPASPAGLWPGVFARLHAPRDGASAAPHPAANSSPAAVSREHVSSAGSTERTQRPTVGPHSHGHGAGYAADIAAPASAPAYAAAPGNASHVELSPPTSLPPIKTRPHDRARTSHGHYGRRSAPQSSADPSPPKSQSLFEVYANLSRSVVFPNVSAPTTEHGSSAGGSHMHDTQRRSRRERNSDSADMHQCAVEPAPLIAAELHKEGSGNGGKMGALWGRVGSWGSRRARGGAHTPARSEYANDAMYALHRRHAARVTGPAGGHADAPADSRAAWRDIPIWGSMRTGDNRETVTLSGLKVVRGPHTQGKEEPGGRYVEGPVARDTQTLDPQTGPATSQRLTTSNETAGGPSSVMLGGTGEPPTVCAAPAVPAAPAAQPNVQLYKGASCGTGELPQVPLKPWSRRREGGGDEAAAAQSAAAAVEEHGGRAGESWWGPSELEARRMQLVEHLSDPGPTTLPAGLMSLVPAQEHQVRSQYTVVQFARRLHASGEAAVKFFLEAEHFQAERAAQAIPALAGAGLHLDSIHANEDGALADALGQPLPPCVVMQRGVPLEEWMRRESPDILHAVAALAAITKRLQALHDAGYAHRNVKPSNILWLPHINAWALTDLRCAARTGEPAAAARDLRLAYVAPELAPRPGSSRRNNGARLQRVEAASDAWALGVIAVQLLTGSCPLDDSTHSARKELLAQLQGKSELPWEGWTRDMRQKLGALRKPVLRLLQRDPDARLSMAALGQACLAVFDASS